MKLESKGWVIVNIGHPVSKRSYIIYDSFSYSRKGAIETFVNGSANNWAYWRRKWNFRAVKAEATIVTI